MRSSVMFMDIAGTAADNPSLGRAPHPFFSVRLKPLGQLGINAEQIKRGNELTCDDLDALRIPWGYTVPEVHSELHDGWSYVWDIGAGTFVITNELGIATIHTGITTIRDLAITVDVFESGQFIIKLSAAFDFEAFLIGHKLFENKVSSQDGYRWGETDKYLSAPFHIAFSRMIGWLSEVDETMDGGDQQLIIDQGELYDGELQLRSVILATIKDLSQDAKHPNNFALGPYSKNGDRQLVNHQGLLAEVGEIMLIYLAAAKLLNGSRPVFEPWMLYQIFQWFVQGRNIQNRNRTFDLSPWWG